MKECLSNEERLARLRARWKREQERQRTILPTAENKTCGVKDEGYKEKIITPAQMRMGERYFWGKRGFETPPATGAGVLGGTR